MLTKCCPQVSFESTASALFQVPYPVSPFLAALTKLPGVYQLFPFWNFPIAGTRARDGEVAMRFHPCQTGPRGARFLAFAIVLPGRKRTSVIGSQQQNAPLQPQGKNQRSL